MAIKKEQFLEIETLIKSNIGSIESLVRQSIKLGDQIVKIDDEETKKSLERIKNDIAESIASLIKHTKELLTKYTNLVKDLNS